MRNVSSPPQGEIQSSNLSSMSFSDGNSLIYSSSLISEQPPSIQNNQNINNNFSGDGTTSMSELTLKNEIFEKNKIIQELKKNLKQKNDVIQNLHFKNQQVVIIFVHWTYYTPSLRIMSIMSNIVGRKSAKRLYL